MDQQMQDQTSPDAADGSGYIPYRKEPFKLDLVPSRQDAGAVETPPAPAKMSLADSMEKSAKGRASHVNDFDLTIRGIADGDPVGMETFDLGFFNDGTPAVVINGANIPIRHEQWMALMSLRNKTRDEIDRRVEFKIARDRAVDAISKVQASVQLPNGLIPLLYAQAEINPDGATKNLSDIYLSMQKTGGKDVMGKIAVELQDTRNKNAIGFMLRPIGERKIQSPNPLGPNFPPVESTEKLPSLRDQRVQSLARSSSPSDAITAHAYLRLEDFVLDPSIRAMNPTGRIGIMDRIGTEQDRYGPMSLLSRLQHIAAYNNGDWPSQVAMQPPPIQPSPSEINRYVDYLRQLDRWAASAFGYDVSSPESIQAIVQEQLLMAQYTAQTQGQPRSEETAATPNITIESKSAARPRAVR